MRKKIIVILICTLLIITALQTLGSITNNIIPNDPDFGNQYALHNEGQDIYLLGEGTPDADIDALEAWEIETGNSDIIIAIIDSGIDYNHPDLSDNIWINDDEIPGNGVDDDNNGYIDDTRGWNFLEDNNEVKDIAGHGTACAGTTAGLSDNGIGISGVCWNCKIMTVISDTGFDDCPNEAVADGIRYAANNGADVISMSIGVYKYSDLVEDAVNYAHDKGIFLVAAAGNEGRSSKLYPAGYDNVIAVGGTDNNDEKMDCYRWGLHAVSNYGDWVDVSAPSVDIYTTLPTYHVIYNDVIHVNQDYDFMSGTSFSCPIVSGIAGLLLSKNPQLTPDQVKAIICDSVDPYISDVYIGTGRVNACKVLQSCNPPYIPSINGTNSGETGENYEYRIMAFDPDDQNITYCIDWGDDSGETCIGPFPSGEEIKANHSWDEDGTYTIRVKSMDIYGLESDWATLEVTMPKNKATNAQLFLQKLFKSFSFFEKILNQILKT